MNEALQNILYRDFPHLYSGRKLTIQQSAMPWGFQCNDGWFQLIYDLSYHLSEMSPGTIAVEVKEKYAELRFYVTGATDEAYGMIHEREFLSGTICEYCGDPGKVYCDYGWYRTMCAPCHRKLIMDRESDRMRV